MKIRGL